MNELTCELKTETWRFGKILSVDSESQYSVEVATSTSKAGIPGQNIGKILRQVVQQVSTSTALHPCCVNYDKLFQNLSC